MSFLVLAACAAVGYMLFWLIYLPVAYFLNRDAEHDPDDDAAPRWLAELEEEEKRRQEQDKPKNSRPAAARRFTSLTRAGH